MENSQLDCLLCTLNFWISGQRGRGCVGGGKRKEDRSKFPSWISSMDKKRSFLLKRFSNSGLLFQVILKGNNYVKSNVLTVHNSFILCAKYLSIFCGFWGSFLCNEGFSSEACSFCKRLLCDGRLIYPWLMENSQLDCLFCTLNFWISGQRGRGCVGGGKIKEDRSKFPSWVSSMDKRGSFFVEKVFK
jgi:hypothetical protein